MHSRREKREKKTNLSLKKQRAKDFALEKLDFDCLSAWAHGLRCRHVVIQEVRQVTPLFVFA